MAHGDEDLRQELLISVMDSVDNRSIYDEGLIVARMLLQRKMYKTGYRMADKYGRSIDNGFSGNREGVTILPYDTTDETDGIVGADMALYFTDPMDPEETALFNIGYERFLQCLDDRERRYWEARLSGNVWRDVERLKIADRNQQPGLRRNIRRKFRECMEV